MYRIATVAQMRELEAAADAAGISYDQMMQLAGGAVASTVMSHVEDISGKNVLVLVGPGNNGGDGLVAGVRLAAAGATVKCYFLRPPDEDNPQVQAARAAGLFIVDYQNDMQSRVLQHTLGGADVLIDALFGTGTRLPIKGDAAKMLRRVGKRLKNHSNSPLVVAVDCPSGLNCDTGEVDSVTLKADVTITFGAAKPGQFRFPAADYIGDMLLADIGWPDELRGLDDIKLRVADHTIADWLPKRPRNAHKGTFGKALLVAGSLNYTGAAYLAGAAAYRSGAGLVTMAVPAPLHAALAGQLPEATWLLLAHDMGVIARQSASLVREKLAGYTALLLGPGWGTDKTTAEFLDILLASPAASGGATTVPKSLGFITSGSGGADGDVQLPATVVDADGLRLLAALDNWPQRLPANSVLTPHPGEMAALTGLPKDELQSDRIATAQKYAAEWGHIVLFKGAFTVIAAPDGRTVVQPFASAALARAGTGDVLAGVIVGLLAQGVPPFEAAVAGAYLHGWAGMVAAEVIVETAASVLASDLLKTLPMAIANVMQGGPEYGM